ncbi:MAG TPA: hypothetical protein VFK97_02085, partial [Candidatus Saccharimonadales bacterium]|nr:hypothetical protein [Candidatus Saccharimonadales bacterium]
MEHQPHQSSSSGYRPGGQIEPAAKPGRRRPMLLLGCGLLVLGLTGLWLWQGPHKAAAPANQTAVGQTAGQSAGIRLIATGDFIAHDSLN